MLTRQSIPYGIDENGKNVSIKDADRKHTYICPYCLDVIHAKKGKRNTHAFSHNPTPNRTPQQRLCPGYKGNGSDGEKIIDIEEDKIHVINGGVPVYMVEYSKGQYELIARFPPLSNNTMKQLEEWDVKVRIRGDGTEWKRSAVYLSGNGYRIRTTRDWIQVDCLNMHTAIQEVDKKWCWGIKGISFENDLFMDSFGGGRRVALHSNIIVGKEYLCVVQHNQDMLNKQGLMFEKKGALELRNITSTYVEAQTFNVYSVIVKEVTDEAIAFVQKKGYQLIEKSDELVPLWPPAAIEGKELIYSTDITDAYLYHKREAKQKIYSWNSNSTHLLDESDNIIKTLSNQNMLLLSDDDFNSLSKEIRFILTKERNNYSQNRVFEPKLQWRFENGNCVMETLSEFIPERLYKEKAFLKSNSKISCVYINNGYIEYHAQKSLEKIKRQRELYIINEPFRTILLKDEEQEKRNNDAFVFNTIIDETIQKLINCKTVMVSIKSELDRWITITNNMSKDLYQILVYWKNSGYMPYTAELILVDMERRLDEEKNRC